MEHKFVIKIADSDEYYYKWDTTKTTKNLDLAEKFDTERDAENYIIDNPRIFEFVIVTILKIWQVKD